MRLCFKNKVLWALIFWPETIESSVISVNDISEAVKPQLIKIGWKGDLPWVDENGITTLYEATILKLSHHKNYLLSIDIDCFGEIIKKVQPEHIMKEKKSLTKQKKETTILKNKQKTVVQHSLLNMAEIGKKSETQKVKTKNNHILKESVTVNKNSLEKSELRDCISMDDNLPNEDELEAPKVHLQCLNCTDCFCKSWRLLITPQFVTLFEKMVQSTNKVLGKNPEYGKNKGKIELYPNTGILLTQEDLDYSISKANYSIPSLVRGILMKVVTPEELVECVTAEGMNKRNHNIRTAILGYLKYDRNIEMTIPQFNEIVKKKIYYCRDEMKPMEEKKKINRANRERVQASREKRKNCDKENDHPLKKVKNKECNRQEEEADKSEEKEETHLKGTQQQPGPSTKSQQEEEHHIHQKPIQKQPNSSQEVQQEENHTHQGNIQEQEEENHIHQKVTQWPELSQTVNQEELGPPRQHQFNQYPYHQQQYYYQSPSPYTQFNYHQQPQHQPISFPHQNPAWPSNYPPPSYSHQQFPPSYNYDQNYPQCPPVTQPETNLHKL